MSLAQRHEALKKANRIRTHRAGRKRELAGGRIDLLDVLEDPLFATAKIEKVVRTLPKVGRVKSHKALSRARISPSKTIGGLTDRQRRELLEILPTKRSARARRALADYPEAVLGSE